MISNKLLLTDNNYQSTQSLPNKKNENLWKKIGKIGNYCQFSIGDAFAMNSSN